LKKKNPPNKIKSQPFKNQVQQHPTTNRRKKGKEKGKKMGQRMERGRL
jgi:hypothetical protein